MKFVICFLVALILCSALLLIFCLAIAICDDEHKGLLFITSIFLLCCAIFGLLSTGKLSRMHNPTIKCPYCDSTLIHDAPNLTIAHKEWVWNYYRCGECGYDFKVELNAPLVEVGRVVEYESGD